MKNKENIINKPFGLLRKELQETIVSSINNSGLPLSVCAYLIKDIAEQVNVAAAQEEEVEIANYKALLAEEKQEKQFDKEDKPN